MNPGTITTATVLLRRGGATGVRITATVVYDPATRTVTLDPVGTLASKTTYTAVIAGESSGVKDLTNNSLVGAYTWSFTTR